MCPPGYHYNGFVPTHVLRHMMYGYTLQVPMNQRVLNKLSKEHNISDHKWSMTHRVLKSHKGKMGIIYMQLWKQYFMYYNIDIFIFIYFNNIYILRPFCFCLIWALCVSWITYNHLYYAPCLACWALFGSLVPAMCNRTSCAQLHEFPQSHCGDKREGTFSSWIHLCYSHLPFVRFEHSACRGSLMIP